MSDERVRFRVSGVLNLGGRLYVCGAIDEGLPAVGMTLLVPVHGDEITIDLVVHSVEAIDYAPELSGLALGVRFERDEADSERLLRDLCEDGMLVSLVAAPRPP